MFKLKNILILSSLVIFLGACSTHKNHLGSSNGWVVTKIYEHKDRPSFDYLVLSLHNAEDSTERIPVSRYVVNGIDLPIEGSTRSLFVLPGKYKIKASAFGLKPIEVTVNKPPNCAMYLDFYLKGEVLYLKNKN